MIKYVLMIILCFNVLLYSSNRASHILKIRFTGFYNHSIETDKDGVETITYYDKN